MSAAFCGNLVEKNVKISALISTLFFTLGMIGTGVSIIYNSLWGIYLSYGVIMGIGLGIGYLTPVKTLMLWFKRHKGLATGIAITGFGLAKVIASPGINYLLEITTVESMFFILGSIYFLIMILGMFLIKKPKISQEFIGEKFNIKKSLDIIFNPTYIAIWTIFFVNITCGLALISQEKSILLGSGYMGDIAVIAALTAFFNSFGRFGYSTLSDKMKKRSIVYEIIFATCASLSLLSVIFGSTELFLSLVITTLLVCNLGYGGGFSTLPSLLSDKFGMKNVSVIHGFCLSAWAWAGLVGNNLGHYIISNISIEALLIVLSVLYCISGIITIKFITSTGKVGVLK